MDTDSMQRPGSHEQALSKFRSGEFKILLGTQMIAKGLDFPSVTLVGVINVPIIHYSVEWWNTLHQGPTVTKFDKPSIHLSMLIPLLLMAVAFKLYYFFVVLMRARCEVLDRERNTGWVRELVEEK